MWLYNKDTDKLQKFKRYPEEELHFLQNQFVMENKDSYKHWETTVSEFEMDKLEQEYDYDTDEDQILRAKEMMANENFSAIEFAVHDDPLLLIGNLSLKDQR